jgi:large subunit ribosomal protein L9
MARRATTTAIAEFEAKRAELEKLAAEKLAAAQAVGAKLGGLVLEIRQKAGVDGRLFGSVTNHDVADALKAKGFTIEKALVRMPTGPLKIVGDHPLSIAVHTDVVVEITVQVIGEQA